MAKVFLSTYFKNPAIYLLASNRKIGGEKSYASVGYLKILAMVPPSPLGLTGGVGGLGLRGPTGG